MAGWEPEESRKVIVVVVLVSSGSSSSGLLGSWAGAKLARESRLFLLSNDNAGLGVVRLLWI